MHSHDSGLLCAHSFSCCAFVCYLRSPELALADPAWFGVSFCSIDGQLFSIGDTTREFSVQSSSKPISYLMALDELGEEEVHRYVGREPSGLNFNDIALNPEQIPHNPMVNSGAIMTCSLIRHGQEQSARFRAIMDVWTKISGEQKYVTFSNSTYLSERATADRNFCLGFLMQEHRSFDIGRQPKSGMPAFSIASSRTHLTPGRSWGANDLVKNLELYFQVSYSNGIRSSSTSTGSPQAVRSSSGPAFHRAHEAAVRAGRDTALSNCIAAATPLVALHPSQHAHMLTRDRRSSPRRAGNRSAMTQRRRGSELRQCSVPSDRPSEAHSCFVFVLAFLFLSRSAAVSKPPLKVKR